MSACNPVCGADQTCTEQGECIAKPGARSEEPPAAKAAMTTTTSFSVQPSEHPKVDSASSEPKKVEPEPPRPLELSVGFGGQRATEDRAEWGVTPEIALLYGFNPTGPVEFFAGGRTRWNTKASVGALGGEFGVRAAAQSADGFIRGGFFVGFRPELIVGTKGKTEGGIAGGVGLGPFIDAGPVVVRVPFAMSGIYAFDSQQSIGVMTLSLEGGMRF